MMKRTCAAVAIALGLATTASAYDLVSIGIGARHGLAVDSDGQAWAWGDNQYGQLGNSDGLHLDQLRPIEVDLMPTVARVTAVAGGDAHSLALDEFGHVWSWGRNNHGQLGLGSTSNWDWPQSVSALGSVTIVAIAAGAEHSLAVQSDGTVWAWGRNDHGQLGTGSITAMEPTPKHIASVSLSGVVQIAAGVDFSIARTSGGAVYTFGADDRGQLGNGALTGDRPTPAAVPGLSSVVDIAAGWAHALAVRLAGTTYGLHAWGGNTSGQLANGNTTDQAAPVVVSTALGSPVIKVAAGRAHSLGLLQNSRVAGAGASNRGQLGTRIATVSPKSSFGLVPGIIYGASIAAAGDNSMAREYKANSPRITRSLYTWGANDQGQLGDASTIELNEVRRVWTFAVGTATGCKDVWRWAFGYPNAGVRGIMLGKLASIPGTVAADYATATAANPGRGFVVFDLADPAQEANMLGQVSGSGAHFIERDCVIYSVLAPRPPTCTESGLFPRDFGFRKENNTNCALRNRPEEHWQHNLQNANFEAAWSRFRSSIKVQRTVKTAVLDTGIQGNHPDFDPASLDPVSSLDLTRAINGAVNFGTGLVDDDPRRHGTAVASLMIARTGDTNASQRGIASAICHGTAACSFKVSKTSYRHPARLVLMKVLDANQTGTGATLAAGILQAYGYGAEVINMSLGSLVHNQAVQDAADAARNGSPGSLLVAAAGNTPEPWVMYPAAYGTVLAVGSTREAATELNLPSDWSNHGPGVDVWATGEYVLTAMGIGPTDQQTETQSNYAYRYGTSFAAPIVSGIAVLTQAGKTTRLTPCALENKFDTCGPLVYGEEGRRLDADCVLNAQNPPSCAPLEPGPFSAPTTEGSDSLQGGIGFVGNSVPSDVP